MKVRLIIFLLGTTFFLSETYGQVKPVYFHGAKVVDDANLATFYGVVGKLTQGDLFVLKKYDLWDNIVETGTYKDEELKIRHGKFSYYGYIDIFNERYQTNFGYKDKDRFLIEKGDFVDGKKSGEWLTYFPNDKIRTITNYLNGLQEGLFKLLDSNGKILISGQFKAGIREGIWYNGDEISVTYKNGVPHN